MSKRKMRTVRVRISCTDRHCRVYPRVSLVHPGQTVAFAKPGAETVFIQVSGIGKPFRSAGKQKCQFKVPKGTPVGIYPYAVFCYETAAYCTGSSMPIIIVPAC